MKTVKRSRNKIVILVLSILALACGCARSSPRASQSTPLVETTPSSEATPSKVSAFEDLPLDTLVIRSYPPGLKTYVTPQSLLTGGDLDMIYLMGEDYYVGLTPLEVKLEPGEYRVTISNSDNPMDYRGDGQVSTIFNFELESDEVAKVVPSGKSYDVSKRSGQVAFLSALFWPQDQSLEDFVNSLPGEEIFKLEAQAFMDIFQEHNVPVTDHPLLESMFRKTGKAVWYNQDSTQYLYVYFFEVAPKYQMIVEPIQSAPPNTPTTTSAPPPTAVTPSPAYTFRVGDYVRVIASPGLAFRQSPHTDSALIQYLDPDSVLQVIGGPQEDAGSIWWQVRKLDDGQEGWTLESVPLEDVGRLRLLEPVPAPSATATPSAAATTPVPAASWQPLPDLPRAINVLAIDPANPQVLYAGTGSSGAGSGVYKSEDAGLTWQKASSGLPSEDVRALAFSRTEPAALYATLGHRGDVFASTDGAQSWTRLGNYELSGFAARLAVAPGDGNLLFVAEDVRGVYRSLDGGHNWTEVGEGLPKDENGVAKVQSLAIDPTDANVIYLGTGWGSFNGNGVYKSTDGGATWAPANRGMIDYGITALAVHPADSQVIYAGGNGSELFKSTDGGQSWTDLTGVLPIEKGPQQPIRGIAIDPRAPDTIYLLHERAGVLLSSDSGTKWHLVGAPAEPDHPSFTAMAVIFEPQPVVVVGIRDEGGWRYATD